MRLKNKKTGKVIEWFNNTEGIFPNTLAELNEEWEDYEEPKDFWYIDDFMIMCGTEGEFTTPDLATFTKRDIEKLKQIGNYFETKEEAEKAVEKLKAWKRLKDKGYRVRMNSHVDGMLYLRIWNDTTDAPTPINKAGEIYKDLDLLFSGEDN